MIASKTLLARKYTRVILLFAERSGLSVRKAMEVFYNSTLYTEMREGLSDMHCRSDAYLVEELQREQKIRIPLRAVRL